MIGLHKSNHIYKALCSRRCLKTVDNFSFSNSNTARTSVCKRSDCNRFFASMPAHIRPHCLLLFLQSCFSSSILCCRRTTSQRVLREIEMQSISIFLFESKIYCCCCCLQYLFTNRYVWLFSEYMSIIFSGWNFSLNACQLILTVRLSTLAV